LEFYVGHTKLKVYNLAPPVYHAISECLLFRISSSILFWRDSCGVYLASFVTYFISRYNTVNSRGC